MAGVYLGVDVGTGSARAGLFDARGTLLSSARRPIRLWREDGAFAEHSSEDIWQAICESVREALQMASIPPEAVKGLGFDATCSLVVIDPAGGALTVSPSGAPERNVICWMDHRALTETAEINATGHAVLDYVGRAISPEMQTPKLLWLKRHRPDTFAKAGHFFDLADYLSYRATGSLARSVCTLTCKWTYLAHEGRFDPDFFRTIGLEELAVEDFRRIGTEVVDIATPLAGGLTETAAADLGLLAGTPIGASLIDAHAGGVGTLGGKSERGGALDPTGELAFIMGTSSCTMTLTREPVFVPGVWGPYYSAMIPGYWLLEGGQSAYGAALDHLVALHPARAEAERLAAAEALPLLDFLEAQALHMAGSLEAAARLGAKLDILPEFLGNRSPHGDPASTALLCGLTLDASVDSLVRLFVAGLCGLSYGTRQIVEANREKGICVETLVVSGGASRSALLRRILADATACRVALPKTPEPVLLGSAMLGAVAGGAYRDLASAAASMCRTAEAIEPAIGEAAAYHEAKYAAYQVLQAAEREVRRLTATLIG
ncbi:MAG: FGGY-family carbohydrate kinase [Pseudomonadota bacterium]|nr:FGGY-family carbohydrate kinase [Pseudomonadota bacterium]